MTKRESPTRPSVLYISYTGLLDPLGQSQVLQYVTRLAHDHRMTLLTFEKPHLMRQADLLATLESQCQEVGVEWHRLIWHGRPNIPATIYDIALGARTAIRLARHARAGIVHTRSYIAGIMGMAVKRFTGAKLIFDMRGFWPDERVDGGIWKADSNRYRFFKEVEKSLFTSADHVVSLTRAAVEEFSRFDYLKGRVPQATVIPTCTNLQMFRPVPSPGDRHPGFTLGYVGSAGSWYLFREVARAVRLLFEMRADAHFLVINQGDHGAIRRTLGSAGVDLDRVTIRAAPFGRVAEEIGHMDAGIFFVKPVFSKRASCPTRMGEFLACGKPLLANEGVGDVAEDLAATGTGIAITAFDDQALQRAMVQLVALASEAGMAQRCRRAAEERFSLDVGVSRYRSVYASLASVNGCEAT